MNKSAIIVMMALFFLLKGVAVAGYVDNGNGTVTDTVTNLMWQQCSDGSSGAGCATGAAAFITWESAISYCEGLSLGGFTDWRLPNIKELRSIVDSAKSTAPAINATYFPATVSSNYWSSTSYAPNTSSAWYVYFNAGSVYYNSKTYGYYVRCVR